jgi:hypothetical protein
MNNTAESGGPTGTGGGDLVWTRYDNSGTALGVMFTLQRNGTTTIPFVSISGGTATLSTLTVGTSGPTIRAGTGATPGTQPAGSLWLRTDGATGSRLYVSAGGGTWNAVAGV